MVESIEKHLFTVYWTDDLLLGLDEIDNQHRKLADNVNKMYELYTTPTKEHILIEEMDKLLKLFADHFDKEYELLKMYDVSNKEEQREEHKKILSELYQIRAKNMPVLVKIIFVNQVLLYYLKEHLLTEDRASIREIKDKKALKEKGE